MIGGGLPILLQHAVNDPVGLELLADLLNVESCVIIELMRMSTSADRYGHSTFQLELRDDYACVANPYSLAPAGELVLTVCELRQTPAGRRLAELQMGSAVRRLLTSGGGVSNADGGNKADGAWYCKRT